MNKLLKYTLIGIGGIAVLLLVTVAIVAATFDPNDYKPLIVNIVKDKKQRTLNIEGDIKLAFWPKLGADLGRVTLSEHGSDKEFAGIASAKLFVAVLPLLGGQLVVDTIKVDGVHANIVRFKDGTTNFDDLLSKEESAEIKFDIDGVEVTNAGVALADQQGNRHFAINQLELTTGHVAKNEPIDLKASFTVTGDNPKIDAKMQFKGNLLADTEHKHYVAKGMDLALQGDVATIRALDLKLAGDVDAKPETMEFLIDGLKLAAKTKLDNRVIELQLDAPSLTAQQDTVSGKEAKVNLTQIQGDDKLTAKLVIANLKGSPRAFQSSGISGEIAGTQGKRTLAGKFSSPFSGDLEHRIFDLPRLAGEIDIKDPALPNRAAKANFHINTHADLKQEQVRVSLTANVDGSKLTGNIALANFAKPNVKFDLSADQLDLNKILGTPDKSQRDKPQPAAAKPADLSLLKNALVQGTINIGAIHYAKYRIANLAATVKGDGQTLRVSPLAARIDDSQLKGSVAISHFERALYSFDLDIDRIDVDRYLPPATAKTAETGPAKPLDLSALKALNADGSLRVGSLKYGKTQASNIRIELKADGEKLNVDPFSAKIDDSQVKAVLGITRFHSPHFSFNVDIDRLDADRYLTKKEPAAKAQADTPLDLSALKTLSANGEARLGALKIANVKTANVRLGVKAEGGQATLAPFSADLYQGSMNGSLSVDARAMPAIAFREEMKNVSVGPLLVDAINNDMLEGKGSVSADLKTQGATVGALKKALIGTAALNLTDGAVKGIDIAGTLRDIKGKLNFSGNVLGADQRKKTDFSEMKASFKINNGVAHNDDLDIKSPLLRITGNGDIDIGNEKLNYVAKPTVVATLKGQGGSDLGALNGLTFPVKVSGPFSSPKYGLDFAAIAAAVAQKNLLGKVGGDKGEAVQKLLEGDQAGALEGLLGSKKKKSETQQAPAPAAPADSAAPADATQQPAAPAPQEKPKLTPEEKAKKKLNELLGL